MQGTEGRPLMQSNKERQEIHCSECKVLTVQVQTICSNEKVIVLFLNCASADNRVMCCSVQES